MYLKACKPVTEMLKGDTLIHKSGSKPGWILGPIALMQQYKKLA